MRAPDLNPNFERELRDTPEFKIAMLNAATQAKQMAITFGREISKGPWMLKGGRGWTSALDVVQQDAGRRVLLVNRDRGGHLYEWGGRNSPPHAILRRAVRAVGMRLTESPKGASGAGSM